ncbi:MAG: MATE family efflux transporter [Brevinemataceae bacterium]
MNSRTNQLTTDKNILKILLTLSIPTMVAGLVDSLYNTVDSMFVGHYVGSLGLAALSVINIIQLLYISIGVLFSVGNASIISRALGAKNYDRTIETLMHSFWITFVVSNLISFFILVNLEDILKIMGSSEEIMTYSKQYGSIILWTGFVLPVNNLLIGAIRAQGLTFQATRLSILGAVLNILLDALFIIVFGWGISGAALATAISQIIMFIFALIKVKNLYHIHWLWKPSQKLNLPLLKEIFFVGLPTGLRLLLFVLVFSYANNLIKVLGPDYLSAFGVTNRLITLFAMMLVSLSIGAQPLIGMNYGAQYFERVRKIIFTSLTISVIIAILTSLLFVWAPKSLFLLFTSNTVILEMCALILRINGYTYIFWGFFICIAEALQAMGHARQSLFLSLSYPVSVLGALWILPKLFGATGIWWAFPVAYVIIGVLALTMLYTDLKRLKIKENLLHNS